MKKKTILFLVLAFGIFSGGIAQEIMRSTLGVAGSSENFSANNKQYLVQQSIGQSSVIGKFQSNGIIARQGFIQPPMLSAKVIPEETSLLAIIYPNPFESQVIVSFNEMLKESLTIYIYDVLGRVVYSDNIAATQKTTISLDYLSSGMYILQIASGSKQFKANIIKR